MSEAPGSPGILARGPWHPDQVRVTWLEQAYEPPGRGGPAGRQRGGRAAGARLACHDGLATRLASFARGGRRPGARASALALGAATGGRRCLRQPHGTLRRCAPRTAAGSPAAAPSWVSTWAGRWALGAGGAVDLGESPAETLPRELHEEWRLEAATASASRRSCALPNGLAMVVGLATVADTSSRCPTTSTTSGSGGIPIPTAGPSTRTTACGLMGRLLLAAARGVRRRRRRPGRRRRCRRCRSTRSGSSRGTAGGSPRRSRTSPAGSISVVISP